MSEAVTDSEFILRVLGVFAFDDCDAVWWRVDGSYAPVTFLVKCSDTFDWGCADCEPVNPETR